MDMWAAKEIRQGSKKLVSVREPTAKQTAGAGERERVRRGEKKRAERANLRLFISSLRAGRYRGMAALQGQYFTLACAL